MTREEMLIVKILEIIDSKKHKKWRNIYEEMWNIRMDDIKSDIIKFAGEILNDKRRNKEDKDE